jgi:hypothetical protein
MHRSHGAQRLAAGDVACVFRPRLEIGLGRLVIADLAGAVGLLGGDHAVHEPPVEIDLLKRKKEFEIGHAVESSPFSAAPSGTRSGRAENRRRRRCVFAAPANQPV